MLFSRARASMVPALACEGGRPRSGKLERGRFFCYSPTGMAPPAPKPWEYQPGVDTPDDYNAFVWFLGFLAPRRIAPIANAFDKSLATVRKWARDGLWYERAAAYDQDLANQRKAELDRVYKTEGAELAKQHLDVIRLGYTLVEDQLEKHLVEAKDRTSSSKKLGEIVKLRGELFREERLVRGQATEIVDQELDLSKLDDQELELLDQLRKKARKEGTGT